MRRLQHLLCGLTILMVVLSVSSTLPRSHAVAPQSPQAPPTAFKVHDIAMQYPEIAPSSEPGMAVTVGNYTYFTAENAKVGRELWRTDGTPSGTTLVYDLNPAYRSSFMGQGTLLANGSQLYFVSYDGLWRLDTETDTLTNIYADESILEIMLVNDTLFFSTWLKLWKSDGTPEGTVVVWNNRAKDFRKINTLLLFKCGTTMCLSDGTAQGTGITTIELYLNYFAYAETATTAIVVEPCGMWSVDDPYNPVRYKTIAACESNTIVSVYGVLNDKVFIKYGDELWITDGTLANTSILMNLNRRRLPFFYKSMVVNQQLILPLIAQDTSTSEIWKSDGTPAGTTLIRSFSSNLDFRELEFEGNTFSTDGLAYFYLHDSTVLKAQLWATDGTDAGTNGIKYLEKSPHRGLFNAILGSHLNTLLLRSYDPLHGIELWRSDGTPSGTNLLNDIYNDLTTAKSMNPIMTDNNGRLYFKSEDGSLYQTEGLSETTTLIQNKEFNTVIELPIWANNRSLFTKNTLSPEAEDQLWSIDNSLQSQLIATEQCIIHSPHKLCTPKLISESNTSSVIIFNNEIFRSDTVGITNSNTISINVIRDIFAWNGKLFFSGLWQGDYGMELELMVSDHDGSNAHLLKDVDPGSWNGVSPNQSDPHQFFELNHALYFVITHGGIQELWRTDGTVDGTVKALDRYALEMTYPNYAESVLVDGILYFSVNQAEYSNEQLWRSDGTDAGTYPITTFAAGWDSSTISHLTAIGSTIYFSAQTLETGRELWKTDGTAAGTQLVADIVPGVAGSRPFDLHNVNGALIFAADDGVHGMEPWVSDGTAAGTHLLADVFPGLTSSAPYGWTLSGNLLYFSAYTSETHDSRSLWAFDLSADLDLSMPSQLRTPSNRLLEVPIAVQAIDVSPTNASVSLTVPVGLTYASDTSGITPTQTGTTLMWNFTDTTIPEAWIVNLHVPAGMDGHYPLETVVSSDIDWLMANNRRTTIVQLIHQVMLPIVVR